MSDRRTPSSSETESPTRPEIPLASAVDRSIRHRADFGAALDAVRALARAHPTAPRAQTVERALEHLSEALSRPFAEGGMERTMPLAGCQPALFQLSMGNLVEAERLLRELEPAHPEHGEARAHLEAIAVIRSILDEDPTRVDVALPEGHPAGSPEEDDELTVEVPLPGEEVDSTVPFRKFKNPARLEEELRAALGAVAIWRSPSEKWEGATTSWARSRGPGEASSVDQDAPDGVVVQKIVKLS